MSKSDTGKLGEDIACGYLVNHGYKILDRNVRSKNGELDIVSQSKDKTLVFVEVKTLTRTDGEPTLSPEDHFTKSKFIKTKRACEEFIVRNKDLINEKRGWRIDLIALMVNRGGEAPKINHYENVSAQWT